MWELEPFILKYLLYLLSQSLNQLVIGSCCRRCGAGKAGGLAAALNAAGHCW